MSFQTAKLSLTLTPFNVMHLRGITPPELLILRELHHKESNGSPIGADLQLEEGEALTIDEPEKAAEAEYFHGGSGRHVPAKEAIPAKTHVRTQREEIERLSKKYHCAIPHIPGSKNVFTETFGAGMNVGLPETFDVVCDKLVINRPLPVGEVIKPNFEADDLGKKSRADLVLDAAKLGIKVGQTESVHSIIGKIVVGRSDIGSAGSSDPNAPIGE